MWGTSDLLLCAYLLVDPLDALFAASAAKVVSYTGYTKLQFRHNTFLSSVRMSRGGHLLIRLNLALTFLAQWHPLIRPKMTTFRSSADWSGAD